jgi:hypothetical protein
MVQIDNKKPASDNDSNYENDNNGETKRYQIDPKELTFPVDGIKNARVVNDSKDIPEGGTEQSYLRNASNSRQQIQQQQQTKDKKEEPRDPRIIEYERLQRLVYQDKDIRFIHLPDDPAYQPISLDAIKMNEFENEDLKLNTRIMMNIALSDYVIFRLLNDDGDVIDNTKVFFRRVKTNEFQDYVDIQTQLDDLVKRVGIIESTYPFTLELQDKLYETQKRLIAVARARVRKGFDIFFKLKKEERELYNDFDNNDISFNVDCAFLRLTKSPFLRRKSSPSS